MAIRIASILGMTLLAAAWPAAQAATPLDTRHPRETVTVDFLLEACSVVGETAHGMIPHFDCESWLYGLLDTQAARPAGARTVCAPADLAPWQAYEKLWTAPLADARRGEPAAVWVLEQLQSAWPCR